MMRDGRGNGARPPGTEAEEGPDQWHQHAGFRLLLIDVQPVGNPNGPGDAKVELQLRVTGLDELHRVLGAQTLGALFGPEFE